MQRKPLGTMSLPELIEKLAEWRRVDWTKIHDMDDKDKYHMETTKRHVGQVFEQIKARTPNAEELHRLLWTWLEYQTAVVGLEKGKAQLWLAPENHAENPAVPEYSAKVDHIPDGEAAIRVIAD